MNADMREQVRNQRRGRVAVFTCPERGRLLRLMDEDPVFHGETLLDDKANLLEAALWTAVRIFKERHLLALQLAQQETHRGAAYTAARYREQANQAASYSDLIQQYIVNNPPLSYSPRLAGGETYPPASRGLYDSDASVRRR